MSNVGFIVTRSVKHLATWTQDVEQPSTWATGYYRPICGGSVTHKRHGKDVRKVVWPGFPYENPAVLAEADRRPLCKPCRKAADDLFGLVIQE